MDRIQRIIPIITQSLKRYFLESQTERQGCQNLQVEFVTGHVKGFPELAEFQPVVGELV